MNNEPIGQSSHYQLKMTAADATNDVATVSEIADADLHIQLSFEYDQLRREILQNDLITIQTMAFVLTAIGVIMGVTFYSQSMEHPVKALLLIIAAFLGFVGMYLETDRVYVMYVIGSYLKVFIEPRLPALQWETRLSRFRNLTRDKGYMNYGISQKWMYYTAISVNVVLALYYLTLAYIRTPYYLIALAAAILGVSIFLIVYDLRKSRVIDQKHTTSFDLFWRSIAREEKEVQRARAPK